ncbi:MAG: PP2C family protein-serine/threonine phosphatase [Flavobacteriales bacterium]
MKQKSKFSDKVKLRDFKLNALLEITNAINSRSSVAELLVQYERVLREHLGIEKLALFTHDQQWSCLLQYGMDAQVVSDIVDESHLTGQTDFSLETTNGKESFDLSIPIIQNDKPIAYLLVGDTAEEEIRMSPVIKHMKFIQTLTNILVVAIQNRKFQEESLRQERVKRELELAAEMQAILLPTSLPKNKQFDVSAFYKAHQQVGGDYYDFFPYAENEVMICMADVSGKGVSAAFLMANFQAFLRSVFTYHPGSLSQTVQELNKQVMVAAMGEKYITVFLASYHLETRVLKYVNCGHNPPVLADAQGYTQTLKLGTVGLGMFEELPKLFEGEVKVHPSSVLICFTDGLVETENERYEEYGTARLEQVVLSRFNDSVSEINTAILKSLDDFRGDAPYLDDLALLSCRFH